jgi:dipeptidyl aminopeptidase/acylaminoacyl peptidase
LSAQKPPLDHNSYDGWNNLNSQKISENGIWVTYIISPQQGDGWLHIYNVISGKKDSVARGNNAVFSPEEKYLVYKVAPSYASIRQAKKKKLKQDQMPKSNLEIRLLPDQETFKIERVKTFEVPEKNSFWMAFLLEKKLTELKPDRSITDSSKVTLNSFTKTKKPPEAKGTELVIYNPLTKKDYKFQDVSEYVVAKDGKTISFLQCISDTTKIDNCRINIFETNNEVSKVIFEGKGVVKKLSTDRVGEMVSFMYSSDTSKAKVFELWLSKNGKNAIKIIESSNKAMIYGWAVSENSNITFSDDGTRLFFGTARKPVKEPLDTLLPDEKYKLDIWSYNDAVLQPMQKKQLDQELKRTYQAVYHIDDGRMLQLADTLIPVVRSFQKGNSLLGIGTSNLKYLKTSSWTGNIPDDYYFINIETGMKTIALEKCKSRASLSPTGKYLLYWNEEELAWYSMTVPGRKIVNLTSGSSVPYYDELNDLPDDPRPHGIAGWLNDEKHVLVYDRYDIWSLDLSGKESPVNMTNSFGRKNNLRFRYKKLDPDADFIDSKENMILSAFNYENKTAGFYSLRPGKPADPGKLVMDEASFPGELIKAKNADVLIWQKGTFTTSPELYISNTDPAVGKKISVTNPQQESYNWGTAELYKWVSFDLQTIQGILYKPENFDPARKYPMIVYFYEKNSDDLYNYISPAPSASIINRTFAVSNGYIVFVPDISYKIGYPGQSCYNAVVSGTSALINEFEFIDKDRIGLDGQSWGGYQIAWLVTQTDLFRCAYAGAAVSNMISAYGGIRWETGMSRMFQYEHTQSRIGGTLWEKPIQYIENSPIFFVPKINTPLLLMHNDADGAVPWYQGIEFITALRRLEKPAWLLSYNDEAHNLGRRANRKDISIRKMQFFDHYLKERPMPYWMKSGISQLEKGKTDGYDLVDE